MNLSEQRIKESLSTVMEPGTWYEVKELIDLLEKTHTEFTTWDTEPLPSEPQRPCWHRLVTNAVRLRPGRDDHNDNSWVELRTRKSTRDFQYAIRLKDSVEDQLVREAQSDDGSGFVYAITNPSWPGWAQIGMTIDLDARLTAYQVYSPRKDYAILHSVKVANRHISEGLAHRKAADASEDVDPSGEWFYISAPTGISILDSIRT